MNQRRDESYQDYAREKLWQSLGCLVGDGTLRQRLNWADDFFIRLSPQHFPDHLLPKFLSLKEILLRNRSEVSGVAFQDPSYVALTHDEVRKAADAILGLYTDLKGGVSMGLATAEIRNPDSPA